MDLYKLKTFRTAALCLNFNQAAKRMNCAQSTVSAQIRALEDEVGEPLFKRVKKRVFLTAAGEKMLGYADKLLAIEREALADISGKKAPAGTISLMIPEAMAVTCLPPVLEKFRVRYPWISLDISNCSEGGLEHDLQMESVDLAFAFSGSIRSGVVDWERLYTRKLRIAAGPGHPLANRKNLTAGEIRDQTLFFPRAGCGYGVEFRQLLFSGIIRPAAVVSMTSIQAIKTCITDGGGIALLPDDTLAEDIATGRLVLLDWPEDLETDVLMLWQRGRKLSDALTCLMSLFRQAGNAAKPAKQIPGNPPKRPPWTGPS